VFPELSCDHGSNSGSGLVAAVVPPPPELEAEPELELAGGGDGDAASAELAVDCDVASLSSVALVAAGVEEPAPRPNSGLVARWTWAALACSPLDPDVLLVCVARWADGCGVVVELTTGT
jgi:hypothetical protein